jgi:hypothetical protein
VKYCFLFLCFFLISCEETVVPIKEPSFPNGISTLVQLGDTRKDVLFRSGVEFECEEGDNLSNCNQLYFYIGDKSELKMLSSSRIEDPWNETLYGKIRFEKDRIVSIDWRTMLWVDDLLKNLRVETLVGLLGNPDILWISEDLSVRQYTYVQEGYSFGFEKETLWSYRVGEISLDETIIPKSMDPFLKYVSDSKPETLMSVYEYSVKGRNLCPSVDCPFKDDGSVKDEFVGMSLVDFVERI